MTLRNPWNPSSSTSCAPFTLLGIIFGVGAVIAMLSIGRGAEREALQLIDTMGLRNIIVKAKTFEESKLGNSGKFLRAYGAGPQCGPGDAAFPEQFQRQQAGQDLRRPEWGRRERRRGLGGDATHLEMANMSVSRGRFLLPFDDVVYAPVCVIGSRVAQVLFPGQVPIWKARRRSTTSG